ncbi:hypothetical protein [Flavobacterium sp.]|uniref:hypothetical protein n=1 Tax=Flavobacterium sp. TaxID=239 RepID=UPI00121079E3|nr:hypothetical protein [Flavobacterium sp.]RZJ69419.1 MAG: hypothetical protein EOO49_17435 [Flavobacterium sp.]
MSQAAKLYRLAFFAAVSCYCLFFARFGFENWDTGFVTAQSWRVANGERAFADFLSVRPPVTAYFHGWIMSILPDYGQVYVTRAIGYLLFALQVYFVVDGLDKLYNLKRFRISKWGAMLVGFILSTGAIYPDPWFTVDGILFASAAFFTLSRTKLPKLPTLALTAFLCVISAGTKQSFYFVPIFFAIWIFLCFGWKKALWFTTFLGLFSAFFIGYFVSISSLPDFISQIAGTGNSRDFIDLGLLAYLNVFQTKFVWLALFLMSVIFAFVNSGNRFPSMISVLKWFSFATFLSAFVAIPVFGFATSATVLLIAVKIAFWRKTKWRKPRIARYFPLATLVGIAWCAGLSKGFPFPVLFVHALAFSYLVLMFDDIGQHHVKRLYLMSCAPICAFLLIGNFSRYRESDFSKLEYDLGSVSPKLAWVISSRVNLEKLSELKDLRHKYAGKYVVAPSLPQAYYLFDDRNPLGADWPTTFELKNETDAFLRATPRDANYIFLEKSFVNGEMYLDPKDDKDDFSRYANYLLKNQKPIEKANHFWVYEASELVNTLRKYPIKTTK